MIKKYLLLATKTLTLFVALAMLIVPVYAATNTIPDIVALFSSSLQSPITATQSTMTLVDATYDGGSFSLASSTYGFIIDEGTSVQELVSADCTGTACTNMTRGLSRLSGTTTIAALQFAHRRGASVKITDAPVLLILNRIMGGIQGFPLPVNYDPSVATSTIALNRNNLASVGLLQDTAFAGAGIFNASASAKGVVQLSTGLQAASSTALGSSGAAVVIPSSIATSTYNSATAALKVLVTGNTGKIDSNFIATSTGLFTNINFLGTTTIAATSTLTLGSFPAYNIGKNIYIASTTGTTTFAVPQGITKVWVQLVGGGAGGGKAGTCANPGTASGGGGGGGGYSERMVDVTGTSTIQIYVAPSAAGATVATGVSGSWTTFGTNGFYLSATGGIFGDANGTNSGGIGGIGGIGRKGDINSQGGAGTNGSTAGTASNGNSNGGIGGSSYFGGGGAGDYDATQVTKDAGNYGGGGGGSSCKNAGVSGNGGAGAQGIVKITW